MRSAACPGDDIERQDYGPSLLETAQRYQTSLVVREGEIGSFVVNLEHGAFNRKPVRAWYTCGLEKR